MSFILSIFLCFAMAFSGTGALPAEPETATTWTIRNVTLDDGTDSFTLDPELRFTTAIGEEKAGVHFEIGNGNRALLPMSAELTPDEIRFAMSNSGRAYSVTSEEFANLMDLDEENKQVLSVLGDFFTSYGAVLGTLYGDEEQAMAYSRTVLTAMLDVCGGSFEPMEVEFNGQTLEGQRAEVTLTTSTALALMDELRGCGIDSMEKLMDSLLALCNLMEDAEYADFAAIADEISEDADFAMPMTVTFAMTDDLAYCLMECDLSTEGASALLREEITYNGEETTLSMTMDMAGLEPSNATASYVVSAQMTGPLNAPTAMHMSYDIVMTSVDQIVYEAEDEEEIDGTAEEGAELAYADREDTFIDQTEIHMTLDSVSVDGLDDLQFVVNYQESYNEEVESSGVFQITAAERREDDDSVTADVEITVYVDGAQFGLSFELNRAEAVPADYFDGLEVYEITDDEVNAETEEPSKLMTALKNDATLMTLDIMQLANDESIQNAMMNMNGTEDIPSVD